MYDERYNLTPLQMQELNTNYGVAGQVQHTTLNVWRRTTLTGWKRAITEISAACMYWALRESKILLTMDEMREHGNDVSSQDGEARDCRIKLQQLNLEFERIDCLYDRPGMTRG